MSRRIFRIPGIMILLLVFLASSLPGTASAERDPLAPVVDMDAPQLETLPQDLFASDQSEAITGIINEARLFGVPLAIRVITMPIALRVLSDASAIAGTAPSSQQIVQRMAEEWLAEEDVETSPGAGDGILLLVVVPEQDHTRSVAAFATGPNALPFNGLTQESIDNVLHDIIYPFFKSNSIATGIHSGIAYLSYDNLFAVPARHELSHQQETLQDLTKLGLATLTILSALALGGLVIWIHRRDHLVADADMTIRSPFVAAVLARGRVDAPVVTGALLHLLEIGAISSHPESSGEMVLSVEQDIPVADPFAIHILEHLISAADTDGLVQGASVHRIQDVLMPARDWLRDDLVVKNLLNRDAKVETTWVVLGSAVVVTVALFTLMPSMMSMSRIGLAAIVIAVIAIVLALIWADRRSWATPAGTQAYAAWLSGSPPSEDVSIHDSIVHQNVLLDIPGGPTVPHHVHLLRQLRGLGAG